MSLVPFLPVNNEEVKVFILLRQSDLTAILKYPIQLHQK